MDTREIIDRLENLWHKLEDEGWYVKANTVFLAIEEINRLVELNGALMGDDEDLPRYMMKCIKQEVERRVAEQLLGPSPQRGARL